MPGTSRPWKAVAGARADGLRVGGGGHTAVARASACSSGVSQTTTASPEAAATKHRRGAARSCGWCRHWSRPPLPPRPAVASAASGGGTPAVAVAAWALLRLPSAVRWRRHARPRRGSIAVVGSRRRRLSGDADVVVRRARRAALVVLRMLLMMMARGGRQPARHTALLIHVQHSRDPSHD
eukprot:COSAG01_NODE_724_length_14056_cov_41.795443_20_plen_181_part_00